MGDVVGGYSIWDGDPTKEASIDILREGIQQPIPIRFSPAKEKYIFQMTGKNH